MEKSRMVDEMQELERKFKVLEKENEMLLEENKQIKSAIHTAKSLDFSSPMAFAKSLIEHTTHADATSFCGINIPAHDFVTFDYNELEEIADYLITYCKHNKEDIE